MPHSPITAGTKVIYQDGIYTVRAVDGNVLELAYHTGDFFRLVHASSVLVCPPPATQTAASLPAPAAGQGAGTLPDSIPPSETLWRFLTNGYGYAYVAALEAGDRNKHELMARAQRNWDQIRAELEHLA